jgi:hypothetical protein
VLVLVEVVLQDRVKMEVSVLNGVLVVEVVDILL